MSDHARMLKLMEAPMAQQTVEMPLWAMQRATDVYGLLYKHNIAPTALIREIASLMVLSYEEGKASEHSYRDRAAHQVASGA